VISDGSVYAWGSNDYGQLGIANKSMTSVSTPTKLDLPDIVLIAPGRNHTVVLSQSGQLFAFGSNRQGQLGQGHFNKVSFGSVHRVNLPTTISVASGGYHCIAVDVDGALYSWGYGGYGQLGIGSKSNKSKPTLVEIKFKVDSISCGRFNSLVISTDGIVYACGKYYGNRFTAITSCPKSIQVHSGWGIFPKNTMVVSSSKELHHWYNDKYSKVSLPKNTSPLIVNRSNQRNNKKGTTNHSKL
jgi:alpha-tubulin suppressor-like RCC1 family protein